ncbi:hypothetical protein FRC07_001611 [Ceratobasidium sp. 392]|nr:hypothetical protein FRC07_001611 [Ceratobasidium sp. 392]
MDDAGDKYGHIRAYLTALEREHASKSPTDSADAPHSDNSALAAKIAGLLVDDDEDAVKSLLVEKLGVSKSSSDLNDYVLELMHKHKDDLEGAPLASLITPTKRPLSRASSTSYRLPRPDTPSASGSPLSTSFRRPHTPASVTSPLAANLQAYALGNSPSASPTLGHATVAFPGVISGLTGSRPASPLPSPRHLNAKALEFRPGMISRQASGTPGSFHRDTPSPDVWSHGSPHRGSSLAIAAPLVRTDSAFYPRPLTPGSSMSSSFPGPGSVPNPVPTLEPSSNLSPPAVQIGSSPLSNESPIPSSAVPVPTTTVAGNRPRHNSFDDEDEFSPFGTRPAGAAQFFSFETPVYGEAEEDYYADRGIPMGMPGVGSEGYDDPQSLAPIEVLARVFGASVSQTDLEDALAQAGWEFDGAIALLMERARPGSKAIQVKAPQPSGQGQGQGQSPSSRSAGVSVVPRETFVQTRAGAGKGQVVTVKAGTGSGASVGSGVNRVCRYYLAGECRRADCRFSHDVERALCRFWLRGQCVKGDQCEFLHTLPQESDVTGIMDAMSRVGLAESGPPEEPPVEDFPLLGRSGPAPKHDPGRSRFAAAAKKGASAPAPARNTPTSGNTKTAVPRPSPRLRLRSPSLLPTLPTGESLNAMYMAYRQRALQLGAARNACLSRAADAWRRGDGAAAKRFSKDAHELNKKMVDESSDAARRIVKERVRAAVEAVRARDAGWSDDARDRAERGRMCGGELGVVLGVASVSAAGEGGKGLTAEERMECLLDLHGLHAAEGVEALQEFLLELEKERYFGLAYVIVGEEKHTGTQDVARGSSKARLGAAVRDWLFEWGYPMSDPGRDREHAPTASPPSFLTAFPDNISGRVTPPTPGPTQEEFAAVKAELASAQQALQEATDAREASETAVRALREFIAENAVGESRTASGSSEGLLGLRLPPLPTDADVADEEASAPRKSEEPKRGWGGWLKRESSNTVPKAPAPAVSTTAPSIKSATEEEGVMSPASTSTPLTNFVSSWTKGASSSNAGVASSEASPASPAAPQPSGFRKFSLFSRPAAPPPVPTSQPVSQVQTQYEPEPEHEEPAKHVPPPLELHRNRSGSVRNSVSSASVSDVVEPVSPPAELVDVVLDRGKKKDEFAGERTPTVGSMTGVAM